MNTFGERLKITIFGESHGPSIGMVLDGIRPGLALDMDFIHSELARRAPGNSPLTTPRKEADTPRFVSGVLGGITTGAPICALIDNGDTHSRDYVPNLPRPSHADLAARFKFGGFADYRGGGHFSGRLTACFVMAGAICKLALREKDVTVSARIVQVGSVTGSDFTEEMAEEIRKARQEGDSVGSAIECVASGLTAGIGGLMFGGMESRIAAMLYAIPGVKGVEFGAGFSLAAMRGSAANDPIRSENGRIFTTTNHAGGINGGLTNGMPLVVRTAFRPTPSISLPQESVDVNTMENTLLHIRGRHDPCLAPRALPVVESSLAFCILDAMEE